MIAQGLNCPALAKKVRAELKRTGLGKLKVDRSTIYRVIRGQTKNPNPQILRAISKVLNLSADEPVPPGSMQPPTAPKK